MWESCAEDVVSLLVSFFLCASSAFGVAIRLPCHFLKHGLIDVCSAAAETVVRAFEEFTAQHVPQKVLAKSSADDVDDPQP